MELPFSVNVVHEDGSLLLALAGELDIATVPVLREAVGELLSPHLRTVTLDLATLEFVDVVGLRALVDVQEIATALDADFQVRPVSDFTLRIIRLAGFVELEAAVRAASTVPAA